MTKAIDDEAMEYIVTLKLRLVPVASWNIYVKFSSINCSNAQIDKNPKQKVQ